GREVEQRLEEAGADDHGGEQAEVLGVELARREHGRQEPEHDRETHARRGCGAAPDKRQARQSAEYSGRAVAVRQHEVRARAAGRTSSVPVRALVLVGAALPILFLHVDYQPGFTVHTGTAHEHVVLSDLVLLVVGIPALPVGVRRGFAPLRAGVPIWIAAGVFLLDVGAGAIYPKLWASGY